MEYDDDVELHNGDYDRGIGVQNVKNDCDLDVACL